MKKIGIFYGSTMGNTEKAAFDIALKLNIKKEDVIDVSKASADTLMEYEILLLGSSTWGLGDLQNDWEDFVLKLEKQNLSGKKAAVFGTGDSSHYSDTFCDALASLAKAAQNAGAKIVGNGLDASDFSFNSSLSVEYGVFCGLALDVDNENNKTDDRINSWIEILKKQCNL